MSTCMPHKYKYITFIEISRMPYYMNKYITFSNLSNSLIEISHMPY